MGTDVNRGKHLLKPILDNHKQTLKFYGDIK